MMWSQIIKLAGEQEPIVSSARVLAHSLGDLNAALTACSPQQIEFICGEGGAVEVMVNAMSMEMIRHGGGGVGGGVGQDDSLVFREFLKAFKPLLKKTGVGGLSRDGIFKCLEMITQVIERAALGNTPDLPAGAAMGQVPFLSLDICLESVEVLRLISNAMGDPGLVQRILSLTTVEALLRLMRRHPENRKVVTACAATLANLACDEGDFVDRIVKAGGVGVCEDAMQRCAPRRHGRLPI